MELADTISLADELLAIVREGRPAVTRSRDRNDQFLWLGLARAFRCLRSIRDVVEQHQEADDAFILTRALASLALRSLWLASPTDEQERIRRGRIIARDSAWQMATQTRELEALGLPVEAPSETWKQAAAEIEVSGGVPADHRIAGKLGLEVIYATAYRTGSGSAHYTLLTALQGFDPEEADLLSARMRFEDGEPERAASALGQACVVFAAFLEHSDAILGHGLFEPAARLIAERFPEIFKAPPGAEWS